MKSRLLISLGTIGLLVLAVTADGKPLSGFTPAAVSDGPLLFLFQGGSLPHTEVMFLCDPASDLKAVPVWRGEDPPAPEPRHRLSKELVVLERGQQGFVWNIVQGRATPLWPGEDQTTFLKADGGDILFLHRMVPNPIRGVEVQAGKNGKYIVKSWFRPRDRLCRLTPGEKAQELTVPLLEKILETGPDGIWAVTAEEPRRLCRITGDGKVREIVRFDPRWVASETAHCFSPARTYLALSILQDQQDFHSERELVVVDLQRKTVCHVSHNVPVKDWAAYPPPIEMMWLDGTHLLFGEPEKNQRVLDAASGKLSAPTAAQRAAAIPAERPERERIGSFDFAWGQLWFAGDKELAGSVLEGAHTKVSDMEISPDGKWAAFCDPGSKEVLLLDGANRRRHRLLTGWSYNFAWLPGTAA